MLRIEASRHSLDFAALKTREAHRSDCKHFITEPCQVYEGNDLKIVYAYLPSHYPALVQALRSIDYEQDYRSGGLPTISRIFGNSPRVTFRKDFCAATSLASTNPAEHQLICNGAAIAESLYQEHRPDLYAKHRQITLEKVKPQWCIGDLFTSGIANKDNQLRYHFDTGNFKDVWSAMLVFKHDIEGGYLSVPEYDLCFELRDHSALLFDGQGLLHGVTPFTKLTPSGYRHTVVYYSLRQMWNCLTPSEELLRIRKIKTQREHGRIK